MAYCNYRNLSDFAKSTDKTSELSKLQEAIWLTVINEIVKFPPHLDPFGQENYCINSPHVPQITQFKNHAFGLVSRLLQSRTKNLEQNGDIQ